MNITEIFEPIRDELDLVRTTMVKVTEVDNPKLSVPLAHVLKSEGKLTRPAITLLCGKLFNYNVEQLVPMAAGIEFLHLASLLHDDTIDKADTRRGQPTVSSIWGNSTAILIGDYLFAKSAWLVSTIGKTEMMTIFAETLMALSTGVLEESDDTYNANQTRDQYYSRIENKTASLIRLASQSGAALGGAKTDRVKGLTEYGYNLGMAFQIIDDILDFTGSQEEVGKPVGSDLLSGNVTLPALLLIEKQNNGTALAEALKNKSEPDLKQIIETIRKSPLIDQSYVVANEFCFKAKQTIMDMPNSDTKKSLLALTDYVIARKK